jgi:hypothetical protein
MSYSDYETDHLSTIQGICRDCGNGTLNNELNPAFDQDFDELWFCTDCGSTHLDIL